MALDFTVKDIIHKVTAKFVPAFLPEAKKKYNLKGLFRHYGEKSQKIVKLRDENSRINQSFVQRHNRGANPMGNNSR
jgi:hypothetical protein